MNESLFVEFISRIFPKLQPLIEKVNGKRNKNLTYLHKTMLRKEYSADQKWESASVNTTFVAADMVAMDSPLPVKKRDSIAHSNGKLPKIGMEKKMKESDINAINIMKAQGAKFQQIAAKLSADPVACSVGIDEKNEMNFLTALSDGYILVEDPDNVGTALRVSFNFVEDNCFGVETPGVLTVDDLKRVIEKADSVDGNSISGIAIALSTYKKLRGTRSAKELVANYKGIAYTNETNLAVPSSKDFDEAFEDETGCTFLKIDRTVVTERNGKRKPVKPFNPNKVTLLVDTNEVGALVWGTLAEMNHPANGVTYQVVDDYKLISKYSTTKPLIEFTTGEALVLPVLENVDQIYSIDINVAQVLDEEAEEDDTTDVYITIFGHKYDKADVTDKFAELGVAPASTSDADYIAAVNELSAAKLKKFKAGLIYYPEVTPDALTFTAAADSTGKTVAVDTNDTETITVAAADNWCTAAVANGIVTVTVGANSTSAKRTTTVTVTVGDRTATIDVEQAA